MQTIKTTHNAEAIKKIIVANGSNIFSVDFIKVDGTLRTMTARLGVTKDLRGGKNTKEHIEKYLNCWDMQKSAYRTINCETVKQIRMQGLTINVGND